jgi:hypothetical protein
LKGGGKRGVEKGGWYTKSEVRSRSIIVVSNGTSYFLKKKISYQSNLSG